MLPVAVALLGAGLDRFSVAFVGWFGPRGLASVIFALLTLEELGSAGHDVVAVIVAHHPAQRGGSRHQRRAGGEPLPPGGTDRAGGGHPRLRSTCAVTRPDSTAASSAAWSRSFWSA